MKKRYYLLALAALLGAPWMGTSQAAPVPLSSLLAPGQTLQSGDKIFSNFTYTRNGDMPSAAGVSVEPVKNPSGDFGVRFSGGFVDRIGGDASDALITFDVSVAPGAGHLIKGAILQANPAVFAGTGLASVTETFLPSISDQKLVVYDFGGGDDKLLDSITFSGAYTTLPVQKDIILHATGQTGAVTMSFVDQYFPQIQVPEPTGATLALLGLAAAGLFRRR